MHTVRSTYCRVVFGFGGSGERAAVFPLAHEPRAACTRPDVLYSVERMLLKRSESATETRREKKLLWLQDRER